MRRGSNCSTVMRLKVKTAAGGKTNRPMLDVTAENEVSLCCSERFANIVSI